MHAAVLRRDLDSVNEVGSIQGRYSTGTSVFHCHSHDHLHACPHTSKHAFTHVSVQKCYKHEKEVLTERSEKEGTRICVT